MYFLDPKQGQVRREWVRDSLFNVTRQPLQRVKSLSQDTSDRVQGYVAQAREVIESKMNHGDDSSSSTGGSGQPM